jgi:hypothetical protein
VKTRAGGIRDDNEQQRYESERGSEAESVVDASHEVLSLLGPRRSGPWKGTAMAPRAL